MAKRLVIDGSQPLVELTVPPNSELDVVVLLQQDATVKCVATLQEHSTVRWHSAMLGGQIHCEIVTLHQGQGSHSQHRGIVLGRNHDKFMLNYWSDHQAAHTTGDITVHAVLYDAAYTDFRGNIKIQPTAKNTVAALNEHTLLLSDRARSDSVPQLDIQTNAVQAAHSSGMSRIDPEQLFYCASRGIPKQQAEQMIVEGFLAECMTDQEIVQLCSKLISQS